jgi:hypothetical protein
MQAEKPNQSETAEANSKALAIVTVAILQRLGAR